MLLQKRDKVERTQHFLLQVAELWGSKTISIYAESSSRHGPKEKIRTRERLQTPSANASVCNWK